MGGLKGVRMMPSIEIPPIGPHLLPFTKILGHGGVYKALLLLCEWRLGGHCTSRWWGHISTIYYVIIKVFSATDGGDPKT